MTQTVDYYFDFGSPNAYLAHRLVPAFEARTGAVVRYVPVLLGGLFKLTGNQAPFAAFGAIPNKMAYMQTEMDRFIRLHGLTDFQFNPHFPIHTVALMRGAIVAENRGEAAGYIELVFQHMWERGSNMGDPEVLASALAGGGFDAEAYTTGVQDPAVKQALIDTTQAAADAGAFGSPTFLYADEIYFGKDQLDLIEQMMKTRP